MFILIRCNAIFLLRKRKTDFFKTLLFSLEFSLENMFLACEVNPEFSLNTKFNNTFIFFRIEKNVSDFISNIT